MSNHFDMMRAAIADARQVHSAADAYAHALAEMLVGRLRRVNSHMVLRALKNELRAYNPHTNRWRALK